MNNICIKNIYAGKPDAKDEINFTDNSKFINSLIIPEHFNVEDLIKGDNCFVTGFKGTGKTALLFYLDSLLKQDDECSCSSFIFFKESYNQLKKSEMAYISQRILSSISIEQHSFKNNTDFEYIWRWMLFKRIVSDNLEYNKGLFKDTPIWRKFEKTISAIKSPSDLKRSIIPEKIKLRFPINDPAFPDTEFEVDLKSSGEKSNFSKFTSLIDKAEVLFSQLTRSDIPYYVFIDELEAYYGDKSIFFRDLYIIRDLIFTVKRFNTIFNTSSMEKTKVICSVRSEIINAINRFIVTKELNKLTEGFDVNLNWNAPNSTSFSHPILQILLKRIEISESEESKNIDKKELINRWFPKTIHGLDSATYILNNTWFKPRDIVRLIRSAQRVRGAATSFNQDVINASKKTFSESSIVEIQEELRALYTPEEIDCIISFFRGFKSEFSLNEIKQKISKSYSETLWEVRWREILHDLYRLGFLGNYNHVTRAYRWQHKGNHEIILDEEWRIMIHYALQSTLSVSSKFDYSLNRESPLQKGDVVTAIVTAIRKSFIFVEFEFHNNVHDGVVHISEINGTYIYNISNIISIGDKYRAKILDFDTTHSNWRLSTNIPQFNE